MIGFQFIIVLLWCRPRRDRRLTQQLAKMELQLDLLKDEICKLSSLEAPSVDTSPVKQRRYTMDETHIKPRQRHKNSSSTSSVFVEEATSE